jgi:hypothetical protein
VALMEMRNSYKIVIGIPGGKRPLKKSRRKEKSHIKMCLKEIACEGVNLFHLTRDCVQRRPLVSTVMNRP